MKKRSYLKIILLTALIIGLIYAADGQLIKRVIHSFVPENTHITDAPAHTEIAFSPKQGAQELTIKVVNSSKESIKIAAYSFTSRPLAESIIAANKRGVQVQVVVDKSQVKKNSKSIVDQLLEEKIPIRVDYKHAIQHNKYIIADGKTVQTGSFNYSAAAQNRNAENVIVLWNIPKIAKIYDANWENLWNISEPVYRLH
ncbi:MAG: phospholipase D family protein [Alphaproteobacteria bacterium]|nr:phospholipase D family protein [Alphaproteobacteria bacterium]MCL2505113.1 phospholipase D family protein [Alphaproteobacteria bacterium]